MSTATPPSETTLNASEQRDPVFDELGFPTDPDNLYTQTVGQMLTAAEAINLQHRVRIILASPRTR